MTSIDPMEPPGHAGKVPADGDPEARRHLHAVDTPPKGLQVGHVEAGRDVPAVTDVPITPAVVPPTVDDRLQAAKDAELKPILPAWASSKQALRGNAEWAARHYRHRAARRAVYAVPDTLRLSWWGVRGGCRALRGLTRWILDVDSHPLSGTIQASSQAEYDRAMVLRGRRQKARLQLTGAGLTAVTAAGVADWTLLPHWTLAVPALAATAGLVRAGKPADKPLLIGGGTVVKHAPVRLTDESVAAAFAALGIPALRELVAKRRSSELFVSPIERTSMGHGYRTDMVMPLGVTALEVAAVRSKVAANLRRQIGQVWITPQRSRNEAAMELLVLDRPLSEMRLPAWPLLNRGTADMLAPVPFGYTAMADRVSLTLFQANLLTGGIPGAGKTNGMMILACAAALDVHCELYSVEMKGTDDYQGLRPIAHRHVSGPEEHDAVMAVLREVYGQLDPRAAALADAIKRGKAPDRRVTPELAAAGIGLHPLLLILDEVQELFVDSGTPESKELIKEATRLLEGIIKRGRALGVIVILGTQSPDAKSLPKSIERLIGIRFALRVEGQQGNDMILGTSAYQNGHRATLLDDTDRGVGLLKRGADVLTVRSCYLTTGQITAIGRRARLLREQAGTLSGDAIGDVRKEDATCTDVIVDCLEVWATAAGDDSAWLSALEDAMAGRWPDRYGDTGDGWLGKRLRAIGVKTLGQRKRSDGAGGQTNRVGVTKAALLSAIEATEGD